MVTDEIKQWMIIWINLDPTQGSEQSGTRPALVISSDAVNVLNQVTVLPLTAYKNSRKIYPNETFLEQAETGLSNDSIALVHQIRAIDKRRIKSIVGCLSKIELQTNVHNALKVQLGL